MRGRRLVVYGVHAAGDTQAVTNRLTIHEVAAALHKSERWLRDWLKRDRS